MIEIIGSGYFYAWKIFVKFENEAMTCECVLNRIEIHKSPSADGAEVLLLQRKGVGNKSHVDTRLRRENYVYGQ